MMERHSFVGECEAGSWDCQLSFQTERDSTCSLAIFRKEDLTNCFIDFNVDAHV